MAEIEEKNNLIEGKRTIVIPEKAALRAEEIIIREKLQKGIKYTLGAIIAVAIDKIYKEGV